MDSQELDSLKKWVMDEVYTPLAFRLGQLEKGIAPLDDVAPGNLVPSRDYVIVTSGDKASKWFESQGDLLRLNPNFPRVAYGNDGHVMQRFDPPRDWNGVALDERLWTT